MAGSEFKSRRIGKSKKARHAKYDYGALVDSDGESQEACRCHLLPTTITDAKTGMVYFRPNGKAYVSFDGSVLYRAAEDDNDEA